MNSTFAQILGKLKKNKMSENFEEFWKFERKKNVKIQTFDEPTDLPRTGQVL